MSKSIESDLKPLKDDQIKRKEGQVTLSRSMKEFSARLGAEDAGKEIWQYLLVMALAFLSLEGFLAWMWGNPK